jgi:PAS domain S-box-containing protein
MPQTLAQLDLFLYICSYLFILTIFSILFVRLYKKSAFLRDRSTFLQLFLGITVFLTTIVFVCGGLVINKLGITAEDRIKSEAELTLSVLKNAALGEISKIDAGVATLAGSPRVFNILDDYTAKTLDEANEIIDRYCRNLKATAVYLLDTSGTTIASSNRNTPISFVGKNYSFRTYFKESIQGKNYGDFAVGVTSGTRGYYSSFPVVNRAGVISGVVVIKDGLNTLDSIFSSIPHSFLVDKNNVVFMSDKQEFLYRPVYPITDSLRMSIMSSQQFGESNLIQIIDKPNVSNEIEINKSFYLVSQRELQTEGWSITLFSPKDAIFNSRLLGIVISLALIMCILITFSLIAIHRIKDWVDTLFLSEKQFQTIFENAPEAIVICEVLTGIVISTNSLAKEWLKELGSCESFLITQFLKCADNSDFSISFPLNAESVDGLFLLKTENPVRHLSVSSTCTQFKDRVCLILFLRDISEMIIAQSKLEASELKYRELADFLPEAIFEADLNGVITYVNRCGLKMFNYSLADLDSHLTLNDMVIPKDREKINESMAEFASKKNQTKEYTGLSKTGDTFSIIVQSTTIVRCDKTIGICGLVINMEERKKIELELQRKDKLEALGILAGGIAHDFNNLLTAIYTGTSLIKLKPTFDADLTDLYTDMEAAIRRGKDLTGQLLTYSKGGAPIKNATSLIDLVKETASFTVRGSAVLCEISSDENLYAAEIDGIQISQVVQNLLINAIESMPSGGTIKVNLRNLSVLPETVETVPPGRYVELIVTDAGSGIPLKIQKKIFDPFFTTKANGSGLGLATAYSVVKKHSGHIHFESQLGKGTTFHVVLPASETKINKQIKNIPEIVKGNARILIMDDEEIIRFTTQKLLTHLGYSVITAANGEEAIDLYATAIEKNERFDAVILDLTVPAGMGGLETVKKLLLIDNNVIAFVSSGYSNDPIMSQHQKYGFKGIISKPYNINEIGSTLNDVLIHQM